VIEKMFEKRMQQYQSCTGTKIPSGMSSFYRRNGRRRIIFLSSAKIWKAELPPDWQQSILDLFPDLFFGAWQIIGFGAGCFHESIHLTDQIRMFFAVITSISCCKK
jgi:hypothetical protein